MASSWDLEFSKVPIHRNELWPWHRLWLITKTPKNCQSWARTLARPCLVFHMTKECHRTNRLVVTWLRSGMLHSGMVPRRQRRNGVTLGWLSKISIVQHGTLPSYIFKQAVHRIVKDLQSADNRREISNKFLISYIINDWEQFSNLWFVRYIRSKIDGIL